MTKDHNPRIVKVHRTLWDDLFVTELENRSAIEAGQVLRILGLNDVRALATGAGSHRQCRIPVIRGTAGGLLLSQDLGRQFEGRSTLVADVVETAGDMTGI